MLRVLFYVVLIFLAALGFAWLADRPGAILLNWQGYEIRASLMVAAVAVAVLVAAIVIVGLVIRGILHAPRSVGHFFGARRRDRGYRALSRGMIAVGAGDIRTARRSASEARSLLASEPLTLLLSAQAAQLAGDAGGARTAFEALAGQPETRLLGLHGLFVEARRQGEVAAARHFAEEAVKTAPAIGWAGTALFDYQCQAGEWEAALATLASNEQAKLVDKASARRYRAVLLTARAMEMESGEPDEARGLALEAHRLEPELVPATVVAGRLLTRAGDIKRASKVLESGWKAFPHPDIAETYASVRSGDTQRDRLKRVRKLAELRANHAEGSIAVARAAVDAHEWQAAREALEGPLKSGASERAALLMAEVEEGEHGDQGRVRQWLTRAFNAPRDAAWVADGRAYERWAPVSPTSGRIDAFRWEAPAEPQPSARLSDFTAEEEARDEMVTIAPSLPAPIPPVAVPAPVVAVAPPVPPQSVPAVQTIPAQAPPPVQAPPPQASPAPSATPQPARPVMLAAAPALGRAPDDPGTEAEGDEAFRRF